MNEWMVPSEFELPRGQDLAELAGGDMSLFQFDPPGPVGEAYMYGCEPVDLIMGPFGSGKTTCSTFRLGAFSMRMPICADGVIRVRGAVLHDNFRALYRTGLESIFRFFPRDFPGAHFEGGQDRPFRFTLRFRTPGRQIPVQIILDGFGIGQHSIETVLRGYEGNFFWLCEADLIARKVPSFCLGRCAQGRYPGRGLLADPEASVPFSVCGDLNPPLITHWIHEDCVENPREGYVLRRQPSGLSDQAENRAYVPRETYEAMAKTMAPDDVRRFVHGEFGLVGDGALVYQQFDHDLHVAKDPLEPLDIPLRIGVDAGGSPALVVFQYTPKGQVRVLDELVTEPGTGIGRFSEYAIDLIQSRFRGLAISHGWGDPSAFYGADRQAGELTFMETLGRAIGVHILPTPTNEPSARQEAVAWFLRRPDTNEGVPHFLMDPRCRMLRAGFMGGFMIRLNRHDTSSRVAFVKNKYSHAHEALQYGCYGSRGHAGLVNDAARAGRPGNVVPLIQARQARSDFNVFDV